MKHSVSHDLGQARARQAAEAAFSSYKDRFAKYSPAARWLNDQRAEISFSVKGVSLKGALEVTASSIDMDLDVPLLLRPFKSKALGVIEEEIRKWLDKAKRGEI